MTKISPVAAYLTANKAVTKRTGNICHFLSREGAFLGRQVKLDQGTSTAYIREIYGEGFKKMYYECKVIGQKCVYFKDDSSPVGLSIMPTQSYILTRSIDYLSNKVKDEQKLRRLTNQLDLIAIDRNTNVGIFNIKKPFIFKEDLLQKQEQEVMKHYQISHTIH